MSFFINSYRFATAGTKILDLYSFKAYWSMRLCSSTYTGALVELRRSADGALKSFYPDAANEELSMSSEDGSGTSLSAWVGIGSATASIWFDQTGNGYDVDQPASAQQPRVVNAGVLDTKNSKPAIYFQGANNFLSYGSAILPSSGKASYFVVASNDVSGSFAYLFNSKASSSSNKFACFIDRGVTKYNFFVKAGGTIYSAVMSTARNVSDQRLLSGFVDASNNMSAFDNGATGGTDTYSGAFTNNDFVVGSSGTTSSLTGYIQELGIVDDDFSADRLDIEDDIDTFYSIP